jgi:hypothetical protein
VTDDVRLEQRYRRLLRAYPRTWRRHREEEALGLLLEQAAAEQRSTIGLLETLDLVGHGLETRFDSALRWLPWASAGTSRHHGSGDRSRPVPVDAGG